MAGNELLGFSGIMRALPTEVESAQEVEAMKRCPLCGGKPHYYKTACNDCFLPVDLWEKVMKKPSGLVMRGLQVIRPVIAAQLECASETDFQDCSDQELDAACAALDWIDGLIQPTGRPSREAVAAVENFGREMEAVIPQIASDVKRRGQLAHESRQKHLG